MTQFKVAVLVMKSVMVRVMIFSTVMRARISLLSAPVMTPFTAAPKGRTLGEEPLGN